MFTRACSHSNPQDATEIETSEHRRLRCVIYDIRFSLFLIWVYLQSRVCICWPRPPAKFRGVGMGLEMTRFPPEDAIIRSNFANAKHEQCLRLRAFLNEPNFTKKNPMFQIFETCTQAFLKMFSEYLERSRARKISTGSFQNLEPVSTFPKYPCEGRHG